MKRTYPKACEYCSAVGVVSTKRDNYSTTSALTEICPVCKGNKVITVIEED